MPALLLVMLGGAIGAGARHLVGRSVTGGLAMGLLAGTLLRLSLGEPWRLFLGVGVLGGYTTFSSFSLEAVALLERGQWPAALGYVLASVIGSIAALAGGLAMTRVAA